VRAWTRERCSKRLTFELRKRAPHSDRNHPALGGNNPGLKAATPALGIDPRDLGGELARLPLKRMTLDEKPLAAPLEQRNFVGQALESGGQVGVGQEIAIRKNNARAALLHPHFDLSVVPQAPARGQENACF
jgi:hypothetical protein